MCSLHCAHIYIYIHTYIYNNILCILYIISIIHMFNLMNNMNNIILNMNTMKMNTI